VYNLVGCRAECLSHFVCIVYNWLGGRAIRFIHIGSLSNGQIFRNYVIWEFVIHVIVQKQLGSLRLILLLLSHFSRN
jgi:hypothetical protein